MADIKIDKLQKPEVKKNVARIERIESFKEGDVTTKDFIIHFKSYKWDDFSVFVNGEKTKETIKNPYCLSRMEQLELGDKYLEGEYINLEIAHIVVGKTGYEKDGRLVAHTSKKHKKERLEICSISSSTKEIFDETFCDFIATEYDSEIGGKITSGWPLNDCLDFFKRKHRNSKN